MAITDTDRREWAYHPVTQEFLGDIQNSLQETQDAWASELFVGDSIEQGAIQNAAALGGVRVLKELISRMVELQHSADATIERVL